MIDCLKNEDQSAVLFNCEYQGVGVLKYGLLYLESSVGNQFKVSNPEDPKETYILSSPEELENCPTFLTGVNGILEVIEDDN